MTIKLNKPERLNEVLALAESAALQHGVNYTRDAMNGHGSGNGFAGQYTIESDHILVKITKKPFYVTESRIKKEVKDYWSMLCIKSDQMC